MNIGIYGGSFNPIHRGHTQLAASIVRQGLVDELWLLVSPLNPLKQDTADGIADYEHRLAMARLATQGLEGVRVSDFERHLPLPSYTVHTLAALCQAYPQHRFHLVIGADNWQRFPRWYRAQDIVSTYPILIYRRPGCPLDTATLPPTVQLVDTPLYDISSTQIRDAIAQGECPTTWLAPQVNAYIQEHHLYADLKTASAVAAAGPHGGSH